MKFDFDIDIDLQNRDQLLKILPCAPASIYKDGSHTKHNTGVYFQRIPTHPLTKCAALDYREAGKHGYFKIDLLNNNAYAGIRDPDHLDRLVAQEPMWELLQHQQIVEQLYHINRHFDIVQAYEPTSLNELAMILALIRPGKRHLIGRSLTEIQDEIWTPPSDGSYHFKHSHATAFAMVIVVQMNLLVESSS